MLRRSHVVIAEHVYVVKTRACVTCGATIEYTTCPRRYCEQCHPRFGHYEYNRQIAETRTHKYRKAEMQAEVASLVVVRQGFCCKCGRIRLSSADVGGVCMWCAEDAILTPARMVVD